MIAGDNNYRASSTAPIRRNEPIPIPTHVGAETPALGSCGAGVAEMVATDVGVGVARATGVGVGVAHAQFVLVVQDGFLQTPVVPEVM